LSTRKRGKCGADSPAMSAADAPPFTLEGVRALLAPPVLKRGFPPNRDRLNGLVTRLNQWKGAVRRYQETWRPSGDRTSAARRAAETLLEELPHLRSDLRRMIEEHESLPAFMVQQTQHEIEALDTIQTGLTRLLNESMVLMPITMVVPQMEKWRHIAVGISDDFCEAMRPTNPTLPLGRSNDGPVPRFVAAVIPGITGEHPSVQNVGKHLKENRDK